MRFNTTVVRLNNITISFILLIQPHTHRSTLKLKLESSFFRKMV